MEFGSGSREPDEWEGEGDVESGRNLLLLSGGRVLSTLSRKKWPLGRKLEM